MKQTIVLVQSGLGAGGAEKIVNLVAKHRIEKGDDVHVLAIYGKPEDSYFEYPPQVQIHTLYSDDSESKSRIKATFLKIKWLRSTFRKIQPDLILSFLTKINFICACALLHSKTPFLVSERNNPIQQRPGRIWKTLLKLTFRKADRIIMQTQGAMSILSANAQKKAIIIPNPCHTINQAVTPKNTPTDIVAVGRLTQQKGFDVLIAAIDIVSKKFPTTHLTIWGEGEERASLENLVSSKNLDKNISLPGNTKTPMEWINTAKIFILPSWYEGFPNVLVEAMSAGMAVIATDCPWGPADMITNGKNGILVPVGNPKALSQAIATLLNSPKQQKLLGKAATVKLDTFSENKVLDLWDSVLDAYQ